MDSSSERGPTKRSPNFPCLSGRKHLLNGRAQHGGAFVTVVQALARQDAAVALEAKADKKPGLAPAAKVVPGKKWKMTP